MLPVPLKKLVIRSGSTLREGYYRVLLTRLPARLNTSPRPTPVVVSLTTTPARLAGKTDIAITTLLLQELRPDRVVLWLSEELRRAPLPSSYRHLMRAGLEVRYCADVGPHTKLIYALQAFPDSVVVSADDDVIYPPRWLAELHASYERAPQHIHCHRAHLMRTRPDNRLAPYQEWELGAPGVTGPSSLLFPTGVGGVLFPPDSLAAEVFNVEAFRRLCPTNDDIWFKAMALLKGTLAQKVAPQSTRYDPVSGSQAAALYATNLSANDSQLRATFDAYDLYRLL